MCFHLWAVVNLKNLNYTFIIANLGFNPHVMNNFLITENLNNLEAESELSHYLSSLPSKITEIYNYDLLNNYVKHDIVCRLIAKAIGANSVSLLLYKGKTDELYCAGGYIDPSESKSNISLINPKQRNNVINVMKYMSALEFLRLENNIQLNFDDLFAKYLAYPFPDPIPLSKEEFRMYPYNKYNEYSKEYFKYKRNFKDEKYKIGPDNTLTGLFYYILTHFDARKVWQKKLEEKKATIFSKNKFFICDLNNVKNRYKTCCNHLRRKLNLVSETDVFYVGIPLQVNDRPIGILRLLFKKEIDLKIPRYELIYNDSSKPEMLNQSNDTATISNHYKFENNENVYHYVTNILNSENIALILSLNLNNAFYSYGMRQIALEDKLHMGFSDLNLVANELTEVVNCYGCLIRISDSKLAKVSVKGYSKSPGNYYGQLIKTGDPFLDNLTGRFNSILIDTFYLEDSQQAGTTKVESIKIDFLENRVESIAFQYFDNKNILQSSCEWTGNRFKKLYKGIKLMFDLNNDVFSKYDIKSIVIVPIREREYGLVSFANTSNRPFLIKDIEMIIPVIKRVGIELKYNNALEILTVEQSQSFKHGLRIIFHQLMSPIVTLRNHIINIKDKSLTNHKYNLRIEEVLDTYSNFLAMLRAHQFLFDYLSHGVIKPNFSDREESFFEFVKGKVRTYQLQAKAQKGIEILIYQDIPLRKHGFRSDNELLSHVLQSLLDNAIKYSYNHLKTSVNTDNANYPPPSAKNYILVTLNNNEEYFGIRIENWGCLIAPLEKDHIKSFQVRGENAKKFDANGSGIGLFVVDIIVNALNGQMLIIPKGDHTIIHLTFKHL